MASTQLNLHHKKGEEVESEGYNLRMADYTDPTFVVSFRTGSFRTGNSSTVIFTQEPNVWVKALRKAASELATAARKAEQ